MSNSNLTDAIDVDVSPPSEKRMGEILSEELGRAFDRAKSRILAETEVTTNEADPADRPE